MSEYVSIVSLAPVYTFLEYVYNVSFLENGNGIGQFIVKTNTLLIVRKEKCTKGKANLVLMSSKCFSSDIKLFLVRSIDNQANFIDFHRF